MEDSKMEIRSICIPNFAWHQDLRAFIKTAINQGILDDGEFAYIPNHLVVQSRPHFDVFYYAIRTHNLPCPITVELFQLAHNATNGNLFELDNYEKESIESFFAK
jgi:hypothetical protein